MEDYNVYIAEVVSASDSQVEAANVLLERCDKDVDFLRWVVRNNLKTICQHLVGGVIQRQRKMAWDAKPAVSRFIPEEHRGRPQPASIGATAVLDGLMNFTLFGSKKTIGNANRIELMESSRSFAKQSGDMLHKSRLQALIAERLPDDTTVVKEVFTEDDLQEFKRETDRNID